MLCPVKSTGLLRAGDCPAVLRPSEWTELWDECMWDQDTMPGRHPSNSKFWEIVLMTRLLFEDAHVERNGRVATQRSEGDCMQFYVRDKDANVVRKFDLHWFRSQLVGEVSVHSLIGGLVNTEDADLFTPEVFRVTVQPIVQEGGCSLRFDLGQRLQSGYYGRFEEIEILRQDADLDGSRPRRITAGQLTTG